MCFMIFPSLCTTSLCYSVSINEKTIAAVSSLPIQALPQSPWKFDVLWIVEYWCDRLEQAAVLTKWRRKMKDRRAGKNWVPAQRSRYKAEEGHGWKPALAGHARYRPTTTTSERSSTCLGPVWATCEPTSFSFQSKSRKAITKDHPSWHHP